MTPDWQLPPGVDRGLWDYMHNREMAASYDLHVAASPLARADICFCERHFDRPGRLLDLGCGTGRLCAHFAPRGYSCVGVDLSRDMLDRAPRLSDITYVETNIVDLSTFQTHSFDFAACLFSTLGMVQSDRARFTVLMNVHRVLKPGGRFVLHVHNRGFHRLGWRRWFTGDLTQRQAWGGAPLTLHHYTRREIMHSLQTTGFRTREFAALDDQTKHATRGWRAYGFLIAVEKPDQL